MIDIIGGWEQEATGLSLHDKQVEVETGEDTNGGGEVGHNIMRVQEIRESNIRCGIMMLLNIITCIRKYSFIKLDMARDIKALCLVVKTVETLVKGAIT